MRKPFLALATTLVAATGLVVAGCADTDRDEPGATAPAQTQATPPAATPAEGRAQSEAAELRATLTGLLEDHVYQAVIAIDTGLNGGLDSKAFKAAAGTLDDNSMALAAAIGGVYGDATGKQFLALWRDHITMFVDYARAAAGKDEPARKEALADLHAYRNEFGAFLEGANPELPAEAVAADLEPHVESLTKVIDDAAARRTSVFGSLREAASHMPMTAKLLAAGIAKQKPETVSGNPGSGASELRATLTGLLADHGYLLSMAIAQGLGNGLDSAQFEAAAGSLDENSKALGDAIGGVYGDEAGEQFLDLWRDHIGMFVAYAKATAEKSRPAKEKALADLDGYRTEFGAFLEGANANLAADTVAEELEPHVESVAAVARAAAARSPKVFDRIAEAASHMPTTAELLAGGIAQQFPDRFPAR